MCILLMAHFPLLLKVMVVSCCLWLADRMYTTFWRTYKIEDVEILMVGGCVNIRFANPVHAQARAASNTSPLP